MTNLEDVITTILEDLKPKLAEETWESRRRYFNQMLKCAGVFGITEPCAELYEAFIKDDNGSKERRAQHIRCVKLVDRLAGAYARDRQGNLFNEPPLPDESEVRAFLQGQELPVDEVRIDYLIVKAGIEMGYLNLTASTIGQYKHSWMDIRRHFSKAGISVYDKSLMQRFIQETNGRRNSGAIKEWKWKINRKAAHVLMEVADTGHFHWGMVNRDVRCNSLEMEPIRLQYLELLEQRNLSKATIDLYDYVFRKTGEFTGIETPRDLYSLSSEKVQRAIIKFANVCNRRSMATILPILRSQLKFFHMIGLTKNDLSGIVMGCFVQRGSVAAYISESDQAKLIEQLDREPKRTKIVILLAMCLGLRDCDICNLTFQEIDWRNDKVRLIQKKTGVPLVLPLLPDVGNALMEYILNERPKRPGKYPYIFLREQAPHNKLTSVYPICSRLLSSLGIKSVNGVSTGVHLFRYTMVHRLLSAKVPHQVISDALGHTSKESDKPYLSMEESMLQMCALDLSVIGGVSWRGGAVDD